MKRVFTATGLAAMFAVGLAAAQDPQTTTAAAGQGRGGPRTVTGCLRAGDTAGTYMLTNVEGLGGGRMGGGAAGSTTAGSTTTGGTTTATGGTTAGAQGRGMGPMSITLTPESSVDLKPHVGHKIEVTGTFAGGGRRGGDATAGGTATGTATTTGGGTTTGTAATTGATSGGQGGGRGGMRAMTATSVKMVSDSCS